MSNENRVNSLGALDRAIIDCIDSIGCHPEAFNTRVANLVRSYNGTDDSVDLAILRAGSYRGVLLSALDDLDTLISSLKKKGGIEI